jgi:enterochelin esterase-like enzyme
MAQTQTGPETIVFRFADPQRALSGVRLVQEIGLPGDTLDFDYDEAGQAWRLRLPPVPVHRMEYRLELRHPDGGTEVVCDPDNPLRAPGAFGDKSVLELAGYRPPEWLEMPPASGEWRGFAVPSRALKADLPVRVWSPAAAFGKPAGLLVAHDGGEFDRLAGLGRYVAAMTASRAMPPHYLVLLSPVERNDWYSANPAYGRALVADVLPRVRAELGTAAPALALGASLGALSLLHAQRRHPHLFAGLFLQSGSFFQQRYDAQEASFPPYPRIVRFIASVRRRRPPGVPVPTVITCGTAEENLANNLDLADVLSGQGYPVRMIQVPDAHNFIAWRDGWHPALAELAKMVWTVDPQRAQDI